MGNASLVFFTCCNRRYEHFAPLYAFSILHHNADALVEIGVESRSEFLDYCGSELSFILDLYGRDSVHVREVAWETQSGKRILPHRVRFMNAPEREARYVYIGDVDILVLDSDILETHRKRMRETGLPYSNSVRPGTKRMSGLHFSEYRAMYPLPEFPGIRSATGNDEELLYKIVTRKGLPLPAGDWFRPTHGIHMSPNREPKRRQVGRRIVPGWGIEAYREAFLAFAQSCHFRDYYQLCNLRIFGALAQIFEYIRRADLRTTAGAVRVDEGQGY